MGIFAEVEADEAVKSAVAEADARTAYMNYVVNRVMELKNSHDIDLEEADTRFSTTLPLRRVRASSVAIIGAGGLGNWQWRVLLGMGFRRVAIFDDDTVGIENIGPQAHSLMDLGMPKVEAVKQAALVYRGVEIQAMNRRVQSLSDIQNALGYSPDIIITCTDSAEFRSNFFTSFTNIRDGRICFSRGLENDMEERFLPKLWLDYRMSLGDWTCYALPLHYMYRYMTFDDATKFLTSYSAEAMFTEEQAVQEPCTARAIVYTGANVASYTGAYLHWFFTKFMHAVEYDGDDGDVHEFIRMYCAGDLDMPMKMTFSARDWEFITESKAERSLRKKLIEERAKVAMLEDELEELKQHGTQQQEAPAVEEAKKEEVHEPELVNWNELKAGDVVNFASLDNDGTPCTILETHDNYMLVRYPENTVTRISIRFGSEIRRVNASDITDM